MFSHRNNAHPTLNHHHAGLSALTLGAIGVVYGDIGTSVLYAMKEVFNTGHVPFTVENIYGVVSLFVWTLIMVVSLKYVTLVLRADNHGEGGLIAMLALASNAVKNRPKLHGFIMLLGVFGTCLFYGDGVITPSISVLSAVEGLAIVSPTLHEVIIPVTLGILFALFFVQKFGTKGIGKLFGPLMLLWFLVIGGMGLYHMQAHWEVVWAVNPIYAINFVINQPVLSFIILGAVVLCVTGAEALYADMGHFGKTPIRLAWFTVVMPCLLLNYFGQAAFLLENPEAISNPFFLMANSSLRIFLVFLATIAAVIASQALISGAFSITKQAMQLGLLPRMRVVYTNMKEVGQIYIPFINWGLFIAICFAVVLFQSSDKLAAAYGIAVCTDMLITTILTYFVVRYAWNYPIILCFLATAIFFVIDLLFWSSNLLKLFKGGWFPLLLGAIMFVIMITWRDGRKLLAFARHNQAVELQGFLDDLFASFAQKRLNQAIENTQDKMRHLLSENGLKHQQVDLKTVNVDQLKYDAEDYAELLAQQADLEQKLLENANRTYQFENIKKIPGIAVFLVPEVNTTPIALQQNLKHNKCLHQYNIFVNIATFEVPWIGLSKRSEVDYLGHNCWKVTLNFGFKNDIDVPDALSQIEQFNFDFDENTVSYFLSRETINPRKALTGMALWREKLFVHLHQNAGTAAEYLKLPSSNVVEMGAKLDI
ncbi:MULTISPECIES: KUP/HAK/KT family potassium transporter [unclassified Acinetobacter]|uniref:KUP/HAK/KT family potassium transporter n=1 Tax=unclassified Acinetobacter TaxID=196816 RepID=UPI0035BA1488